MQIRPLLIATAATALLSSGLLMAQTPVDTLQRSMTLQRAYIPETGQATKEFFNPLASQTPRKLQPLDFARNTYNLSMKARPRLFDPSENSLAPEYGNHNFYARLFGGYPVKAGGNVGTHFRAGEYGTITLGVDHTSQLYKGRKGVLDQATVNTTHDTEGQLSYSQKLTASDRLLTVEGFGYHHAQTLYGSPLSTVTLEEIPSSLSSAVLADPSLQKYYGGGIALALSPAPLSALSTWEYSLTALVDYGVKDDWFAQTADHTSLDALKGRASGLHAKVAGGLTYGDKIYDFRFGVDGSYELMRVAMGGELAGLKPAQILGVTPHFDYVLRTLQIRAGVKVQLPTIGSKRVVIAPDAYLRWRIHDMATVVLSAQGGTRMLTMRDLYRTNRYAQAMSLGSGVESALYDISGGVEIGPWSGLAIDLKGGYADYRDFYDFGSSLYGAPIPQDYQGEPLADIALFHLRNLGRVGHGYVSLGARYAGAEGLRAALGVKYNHYARPEVKSADTGEASGVTTQSLVEKSVLGRPALEMTANLAYSPIKNLTLSADFVGLGGIKMQQLLPSALAREGEKEVYTLPFLPKLDAQISYRLMDQLGLSLTVENILNQPLQRWSYYDSPGIGVWGSITLEL